MNDPSRLYQCVIVGSGFGGLGMAIQLKRAGIEDFVVLEKAASMGGTWRDNTYPGAACDVQSHLYSFSFKPKHDWTRKFATQAEILGYLEDTARQFDLSEHFRFGQGVIQAKFDEDEAVWEIETEAGVRWRSRILITACGQLNRPAYPKIPGLDSFAGAVFHSARWDHEFDLRGKSVAVIGTGASAIQFLPRILPQVKSLKLFQRSGAWVIRKRDRPFSRFEQTLFARVPGWDRLYRGYLYVHNELLGLGLTRWQGLLKPLAWRAQQLARQQVRDPAKRCQLTPNYALGCKRLLLANDWYAAIDQDHLELITGEIRAVHPDGIHTNDGRCHKVDAIILGTGFEATDFLAPMQITGLQGRNLNQAWRDGAEAYKGINLAGFPNLFMLYGPNTNLGHNSIVSMLESQIQYILKCVRLLQQPGLAYMDVKASRQRAFVDAVQEHMRRTVWASGCHSWYQTADGRNTNNWPGFTFHYRWLTRRVRVEDYAWVWAAPSGTLDGAPRGKHRMLA